MRILLDESLPHDLAPLIDGHIVSTVRGQGWSGIKNGKLLALAATSFDAFVSADRNLEFHEYKRKRPTKNVQALLDHIGTSGDPIFWG